jgi:hypothetical protein
VKWLANIFTFGLISGWLLVASPGVLPLFTSLLLADCVADTVSADTDDPDDSSLAVDDSALPASGRMQLVFRPVWLRDEPVRAADELILVRAVAQRPPSDAWRFRERTAAAPRAPNRSA